MDLLQKTISTNLSNIEENSSIGIFHLFASLGFIGKAINIFFIVYSEVAFSYDDVFFPIVSHKK